MSDSVHFTIGDHIGSYLQYDFTAVSKIYVGIQIYWPAATLAAWLSDPLFTDSPLMVFMRATGGGSTVQYLNLQDTNADAVYDAYTGFDFGNDPAPDAIPDAWHKVETLRDDLNGDGPSTLTVDETLLESVMFSASFANCGQVIVGGFQNHSLSPAAGELYVARIKIGTTDGGSDILDFDAATAVDLSAFTVVGTAVLGSAPVAPPPWTPVPPPTPSLRFFEGYPWRFLFTAIDVTDPFNPNVMETTSWAQGLLTARQIAFTLGQSTTIDAAVWPDDIRVNEIWTDGYPRVAPLKRMVWGFRREDPSGGPPWVCRAAGILMSPQDEGDADVPLTHFTAYDPRKLLEGRPVMDAVGSLPGPDGFTIFDHGNVVALTYLKNTIENEGGVFIDAGVSWGGTAFYGGTIDTTDEIDFTVQQGSSVADVWSQLEQSGNCDIILTAIYDPVNRPGYTHEVSIFALAGQEQPAAVFGWDKLNRAVTKISRLHDQTPGAFFDKVQYFAGPGGPPVPLGGPLVNAAALAAFGSVWQMQFFPTMTSTDPTGAAVLALAAQALQLSKQGKRTMTLEPTPERAPIPLVAYGLGDRVPIYATKRLRVAADGYQRVEGIPLQIDDDGTERVGGLLCSPDWRGSGDS